MAKIHKRTVQKNLHDQDNHDGVITQLEPDILECEVKWALESITTNKASGCDRIPVELFQILEDDAVKVLHSVPPTLHQATPDPRLHQRHWTLTGKSGSVSCGNAKSSGL